MGLPMSSDGRRRPHRPGVEQHETPEVGDRELILERNNRVLRRRSERALGQLREAQAELTRIRTELAATNERYHGIVSSTYWRLGAPLRKLVHGAKRTPSFLSRLKERAGRVIMYRQLHGTRALLKLLRRKVRDVSPQSFERPATPAPIESPAEVNVEYRCEDLANVGPIVAGVRFVQELQPFDLDVLSELDVLLDTYARDNGCTTR